MTWLYENPLIVGSLGVITAVVLVFAWLQTGKRPLLHALGVVVILTILGLLIERMVESDRESIEALLYRIAEEVEQNEIDQVLSHIDASASDVRGQAEGELPKYKFSEVNIKSNLEILFDNPRHPTEATARFNVVVAGSHRDGSMELWRVPRYVIVKFRKEGSAWLVFAYEHRDPQVGYSRNRATD